MDKPARSPTRRVRYRLGTETIDQLCADYVAGASTLDLARRYEISKVSVTRLLRGRGVSVRTRGNLTSEEIQRAANFYALGKSAGQVAAIMGRPTSTIYHALRRAGAETRSQKQASRVRYGITDGSDGLN